MKQLKGTPKHLKIFEYGCVFDAVGFGNDGACRALMVWIGCLAMCWPASGSDALGCVLSRTRICGAVHDQTLSAIPRCPLDSRLGLGHASTSSMPDRSGYILPDSYAYTMTDSNADRMSDTYASPGLRAKTSETGAGSSGRFLATTRLRFRRIPTRSGCGGSVCRLLFPTFLVLSFLPAFWLVSGWSVIGGWYLDCSWLMSWHLGWFLVECVSIWMGPYPSCTALI